MLRIVIKITRRTYHTEASPGPMKAIEVLVAEDKAGDVFLANEALRFHNLEFQLRVPADDLAAFPYIEELGQAPCSDVFLLDLNLLPEVDGQDALNTYVRILAAEECR